MELVETLLDFIRASRDGNWLLYLDDHGRMLPWFSVYDHINYARWAPVFYADMIDLQSTAPEAYEEYKTGNFVLKKANGRFNQVPIDQGTEWINKMCKA